MVSLSSLCQKDVISIITGQNIGRVDDLEFSQETARIESLVVFGRLKLWGLFGREQDIKIPWEDVVTIGCDAILINSPEIRENGKKSKGFISFE
ncbi:MAG: YlmC/YmxH family sporulation protein [Oscillospiraceae bacterium]